MMLVLGDLPVHNLSNNSVCKGQKKQDRINMYAHQCRPTAPSSRRFCYDSDDGYATSHAYDQRRGGYGRSYELPHPHPQPVSYHHPACESAPRVRYQENMMPYRTEHHGCTCDEYYHHEVDPYHKERCERRSYHHPHHPHHYDTPSHRRYHGYDDRSGGHYYDDAEAVQFKKMMKQQQLQVEAQREQLSRKQNAIDAQTAALSKRSAALATAEKAIERKTHFIRLHQHELETRVAMMEAKEASLKRREAAVRKHELAMRQRMHEADIREKKEVAQSKAANMIQRQWRVWKATRGDVIMRKGLQVLRALDQELTALLKAEHDGEGFTKKYVAEVLERQLEKCDAIVSQGNSEIRKQRKAHVRHVMRVLQKLDASGSIVDDSHSTTTSTSASDDSDTASDSSSESDTGAYDNDDAVAEPPQEPQEPQEPTTSEPTPVASVPVVVSVAVTAAHPVSDASDASSEKLNPPLTSTASDSEAVTKSATASAQAVDEVVGNVVTPPAQLGDSDVVATVESPTTNSTTQADDPQEVGAASEMDTSTGNNTGNSSTQADSGQTLEVQNSTKSETSRTTHNHDDDFVLVTESDDSKA